ncbi:Glycosyl transferase family 2 [Nitrosotalea sinensis]|uniref:Glycosyl transferase family 2 n=1 Tax=Nitrosotalea sinensis TaxID=1499975 RepID=A0A2H1EEK5_9ARCH|nr:cellulose synthase family protein [Candidatus Nitrosotalea sinensis]SHO43172.1 Glycosyl transferase family 2 [Candidatus Nitrosotalea sinensis]
MLTHAIPNTLTQFLWNLFLSIAMVITLYTCNFYYLVMISRRQKKNNSVELKETPTVTVQLPIYNEKYVAARLVNAVCALDYPKDKLCIQVLDDSNDETYELLENLVSDYKKNGFDIHHIRRSNRKGYKAGALRNAMKFAKGDFIAIFDADFIPPTWFLKKALSYFCAPNIGLVQCRWGHVNEKYSPITKAQALSLDFHFLIEQKAKSNSHLFMSFNGTAGIWRRQCIEDSGGWHTATLVEDLDLSYRAQMKGWKCVFIPDIVVDAELPVQMNAAKRQQFRWAKGSIQCAIKLLGDVAIKKMPVDTKVQAFVQLTRHIVHPLVLAQFLILPILLASKINLYIISGLPVLTIVAYLAMGPIAYMLVIQKMYAKKWKSKALSYLYLLVYSAGMSVNNTVAVFDALFGNKNEFLRTPKFGIIKNDDDWRDKAYALPFTKTTLLEIFFGVYGIIGMFVAIFSNNPIFVPIIGIQVAGFLYIAYLSISHSTFKKGKSRGRVESKAEKMANSYYKAALAGIIGLIVLGVVMAFEEYGNTIYPLDQSRGLLARIQATSDPQSIHNDIATVKQLLPKSGNPVWIFPTEETDFGLMQRDLSTMQDTLDKISTTSEDSAAFHTGMLNIHAQATTLVFNLLDATPYMYVSVSNMLFGSIWVGVIIGIFAFLKRKKDKLKDLEEDA